MSTQLTDSYREMEDRVSQLNHELHHLAEQRLQELQEKERVTHRLESLLNLLPAGVLVLDNKGVIVECNPAALELLGEPLEGLLWRDVIARSFAPRNDDGHEISLRDGRRVSLATRSFEGGAGQLLLLTDMTETRELQQRLSRHQRLSEMGKMMSSLAHQIRTPLSAAMLYAGHLCDSTLSQEQSQRFAEKTLSRLTHMEQQIKGMLIFIKGDVKLTDSISLGELMADLEAAMDVPVNGSGSHYQLLNQCPDAVVQCNRDSMIGALMNLVTNAIQAAGSGVELTVKAEQQGQQVILSIQDNGPGIADDVLRNIAEPFYTTKAQGTGLGLAIVRAVVQAHQGEFTLSSEAGQGTTAQLTLPVIEQVFGEQTHES
jgi:two-component system sensor histidine kinase FlrB